MSPEQLLSGETLQKWLVAAAQLGFLSGVTFGLVGVICTRLGASFAHWIMDLPIRKVRQ